MSRGTDSSRTRTKRGESAPEAGAHAARSAHADSPACPVEEQANPLAGVLDRLLGRERGELAAIPPARVAPEAEAPAASPAETAQPGARRMLVVAGLGVDDGAAALKFASRWAVEAGRRPAVLDMTPEETPSGANGYGSDPEPGRARVAVARIACGVERLREESAEVISAVLEKLRRHETGADLLVVRIPARSRMVLMRAALLAGNLVVPLDDSDGTMDEAYGVSREAVESLMDLCLWPHSRSPEALRRYLGIMRDFFGKASVPFDRDLLDLDAELRDLPAPPEEGFSIALLDLDSKALPSHLLRVGHMEV